MRATQYLVNSLNIQNTGMFIDNFWRVFRAVLQLGLDQKPVNPRHYLYG